MLARLGPSEVGPCTSVANFLLEIVLEERRGAFYATLT